MAKAENTASEKVLTKEEKVALAREYYEEKVTETFPLTGERENNEIHAALNGKNYIIKRGETVTIPRAVYDIINESNRQKENLFRVQDSNKMKNDK